jgi:hypothetical protein
MVSKKAKQAAEAVLMVKDQTSTDRKPAAVQLEPIKCPKCMGKDEVEMPVVDDKGEIISGGGFNGAGVSAPFCKRCMGFIHVLAEQVWEDSPERLPMKPRKPRRDGAA